MRRPDPADRRGLLIELTQTGKRLVYTAVTDHVANEHRLLKVLSPAVRHQLAGLLRRLLDLPTIEAAPTDRAGRSPATRPSVR